MNSQNFSVHRDPRQLPPADFHRNQAPAALHRFGFIAVMMLVAALSAQAQDIFMRVGGQAAAMGQTQTAPTLAGESTDPQYTNWIPVLSMSHGVSRPVSMTSGGNMSVGNPSHSSFSYMKVLDKTTPSINLLVNGATASVTQPIDYVTIDFRKSGSTEVFYRIELQGVYLESAQMSGSSGGGLPSESVSLFYTKIRWSYVKYESGKAQTPITTGWDLVTGKAF